MNDKQKDECKKAYYHTDIEPTLDRLYQVKEIVSNFDKEGANRLMCALSMRHMDLEEIERLAEYIGQVHEKMEKELIRLKKYEPTFNNEFATDHNDYYNSTSEVLRHIRSHLSPLKIILKKFCPRKHPSATECQTFDIPQKSIFEGSILGTETYQLELFDLSTYPSPVQGLFTEMIRFFRAENDCMNVCTSILEEELNIRKDPVKSKYLLDKYRREAYKRMENQIISQYNKKLQ